MHLYERIASSAESAVIEGQWKNTLTYDLAFSQHVRDGVLAVVTDGDVQFHLRRTLECEPRFTTVCWGFGNREILPSRFVEWEESLICGLLDGPSDCEESKPPLGRDRV